MKKSTIFLGIILIGLFITHPFLSQGNGDEWHKTPLDMENLKKSLSYVRGERKSDESWPRIIKYRQEVYDFKKDAFTKEEKTFEVKNRPLRIIPHAVGINEILWAICPRERIIAFNEFSADPEFCFIADQVKKRGPIFKSRQTELVIGNRPDLVFTVFYSGADFKEKLKQAKIPFFDLGYFGTIESIKKQTLLLGKIIGEEGNASALVSVIDKKLRELKKKIPKTAEPIRVLYYDEGGYIPGKSSNFTSICEMINVVNVGAEQGIKSWSQIDYETLLKWDPDIIIVPEGSNLKEQLMANEVLSHADAIKNDRVYYVPGVYLRVDSQFMLLSANLLAGIVYENPF
ncbi:MAG: ABC transporter substrate-binding protein [Proteobacteria bacterium]|nr:ABC transporter substrate-binding protein [Pseudomonadota bacterium]